MRVKAHVFVSGRVQGVFFRSEAELQAKALNVTGWIRNLADGRVEAVFEGEETNVRQLVDFCKRGPPGASVRNAKAVWQTYTGEFDRFEVRSGLRF